jgi:hypothetical protein
MEVKPDQTSTLGLNGVVQVSRANRTAAVLLRRGEGVDVGPSVGPLEVKRWAPQRANALLARFGP